MSIEDIQTLEEHTSIPESNRCRADLPNIEDSRSESSVDIVSKEEKERKRNSVRARR